MLIIKNGHIVDPMNKTNGTFDIAAEGAVMYAAFSSKDSVSNQAAQFGEGGGFDISNSQKIAAYNLLMNSKEE